MPYSPLLGEIMYFAGAGNPPKGWATCDGQLLSVQSYQALFSLLGTQFGGNGTTTFGLPDLRGRTAMGTAFSGGPVAQGAVGGTELHTLTIAEMPSHTHGIQANSSQSATSDVSTPTNGLSLGQTIAYDPNTGDTSAATLYSPSLSSATQVASSTVGGGGGSQGHENRQPYLVITACIALVGIFPSRQ